MWFNIVGIFYLTTSTFGDQPKIVIIGAGAAGIAAASKLYEHGFQNITILEAEDRIGGRVHTTWFDNNWVDLGGQHVHGETNNIAFELAEPLGLLEIPQDNKIFEFTVYNSKGCQIPTSVSNNLIEMFSEISETREKFNGTNGSIGDYIVSELNTRVQQSPSVNETLLRHFMYLFEGFSMASDASDNWYEPSTQGYLETWNCAGSLVVNWKDRGYGTILDILMKKYPNPEEEFPILNNTKLNSEAVKIDYQSIEGKALVVTSDGEQYIADHVITTPSLGVLKERYGTLFTPQLSESKVKTIQGLAFGSVAKIYLSFEEPWWPENSTHFAFIWDDNDRQEYESDPDKKWLLGMVGPLVVEHRPRILCGWLSGVSARYMETLPEDQVLNQTLALFNKFLGKSYNITRPTEILRTKWYSNKHFRGSYSFRSVESEKADVWADQLAAPLMVNDRPIVMFAGEATHPHYFSTVHGAIESGFREANRLIDIYMNKEE